MNDIRIARRQHRRVDDMSLEREIDCGSSSIGSGNGDAAIFRKRESCRKRASLVRHDRLRVDRAVSQIMSTRTAWALVAGVTFLRTVTLLVVASGLPWSLIWLPSLGRRWPECRQYVGRKKPVASR